MLTYETPGVYYEKFDASPPKVAAIRTDIAAFVGIAERGPIDTPVAVESVRQFESHFGGFIGTGYLAYTVRAFFENSGRRCWVIRIAGGVAGRDAQSSSIAIDTVAGNPGLSIQASSPGVWGDILSVELHEVRVAQATIHLVNNGDRWSSVDSTSGFDRRGYVRLQQAVPGGPPFIDHYIVSDVDPVERRLVWVHDDLESRLATDKALAGFVLGQPIRVESLEYEILLRRNGELIQTYRSLSLVPEHDRYIETILKPVYKSPELEARSRVSRTPRLIEIEDQRDDVTAPIDIPVGREDLTGGADGLASLKPYDFVGEDVSPHDNDELQRQKRRGVRASELVHEISIIAVPDIHIQPVPEPATAEPKPCIPDPCLPTTAVVEAATRPRPFRELPPAFDERAVFEVQDALITHCESRRDRMAIIDPPYFASHDSQAGIAEVREWRKRFDSKFAAMYWPWAKVSVPVSRGRFSHGDLTRLVPPSGHVAGNYAAADFSVGVHKAPANSPINWIQDVTVSMEDATHGLLNTLGINAIRALPARGIRVMGSRTVSSDPDARFVNVRRLIMMITKAIDLATQWAVFEPHNDYTRAMVRVSIAGFLTKLWQDGALVGSRSEEAFFVRCDARNNPPSSRDMGYMIADIGIAPSVPFEFVVLRVGRVEDALEVSEMMMKGGRQ